MTDAVVVSVVIPAYNQASLLLRLLESLEVQRDAPPFEVIVIDDCSPDDTAATVQGWIAKGLPFPAEYHCLHKNSGPGKARNAGLRRARGRIVAFTDTDCVAEPDWLAKLIRPIDPDAGWVGVGGAVKPLNRDTLVARYNATYCSLEPPRSTQYPTPFLVSCNCCYLREPLLAVGGFAEDLPSPGGEDVAASIRLFKQGWRFEYAGDAVIHHDFRDTLRGFVKTWRNYGFGCGLVAHRMLTPKELNPEWLDFDVDNFWIVTPIRPTITGIRSTIKDLVKQHQHNQTINVPFFESMLWLLLRAMERWAYYYGWRQGMALHQKESRSA